MLFRSRRSGRGSWSTKPGVSIAAAGNVDYLRQGERQFTDEGWGVVFESSDVQRLTMLTGPAARQKFGPRIDVGGSGDFRERTAMLAVAYWLDVMFCDDALEARRLQLVETRQ